MDFEEDEQMRIALALSQEEHDREQMDFEDAQLRGSLALSQEEHEREQMELDAVLAASLQDNPSNDGSYDESELSEAERASLDAYLAHLYHNRHLDEPRQSNGNPNAERAQLLEPNSSVSIRADQDAAYDESLIRDAEIERIEEERQQHEILEQQRRAAQQVQNEEIIRVFESTYLNGDITIRFEYMARPLVELRLNISTPIHLLTEYLSSKYNLLNVELSNALLGQLQADSDLSGYCKSGARIKLNITAESAAGGYNHHVKHFAKISKRQNRKRQNSKRQNNKRQNSKRQNSKRQNSKRQNNKRQNSKRQNNKRMFQFL